MNKKPSKSTKEAPAVKRRFYLPVTSETVQAKDMPAAQDLSTKKEEVGDVNP